MQEKQLACRSLRCALVVLALSLVATMVAVVPFAAHAETVYTEDALYYTFSNDSVTITGYFGEEEEVEVPALIADHPVNVIAVGAFVDTAAKKVKLPDSITTIEEGAFSSDVVLVYNANTDNPTEIGGSSGGDDGGDGSGGTDDDGGDGSGGSGGGGDGSGGSGGGDGSGSDGGSDGTAGGTSSVDEASGDTTRYNEQTTTDEDGNTIRTYDDANGGHHTETLDEDGNVLIAVESSADGVESEDADIAVGEDAAAEGAAGAEATVSSSTGNSVVVIVIAAVIAVLAAAIAGVVVKRRRAGNNGVQNADDSQSIDTSSGESTDMDPAAKRAAALASMSKKADGQGQDEA